MRWYRRAYRDYLDVGHDPNTDTMHSMIWWLDPDRGSFHVGMGGLRGAHTFKDVNPPGRAQAITGRCEVDDAARKIIVSIGAPDVFPEEVADLARAEAKAHFHPEALANLPEYKSLFPEAPDPSGYAFRIVDFNQRLGLFD